MMLSLVGFKMSPMSLDEVLTDQTYLGPSYA